MQNGGADMKVKTLTDNNQQIVNADAAIKAAHELKRKLIEQSKVIVYSNISEQYGLEGQALLDAVTKEHTLISKFTASGMTYDEIESLVDGSADEVSADDANEVNADDTDNSSDDADSEEDDTDDSTIGQTSFFGNNNTYTD